MSDLVSRLRIEARRDPEIQHSGHSILSDAADEIAALTARAEHWKSERDKAVNHAVTFGPRISDLELEIERLQTAKREALKIADERSKENVALRAALAEVHDMTQETRVPYYQIVQNIAAVAKKHLADEQSATKTETSNG